MEQKLIFKVVAKKKKIQQSCYLKLNVSFTIKNKFKVEHSYNLFKSLSNVQIWINIYFLSQSTDRESGPNYQFTVNPSPFSQNPHIQQGAVSWFTSLQDHRLQTVASVLLVIGIVTCEVPAYDHQEGKPLSCTTLLWQDRQSCSHSQGTSQAYVRQEVCITFLGHSNVPDNPGVQLSGVLNFPACLFEEYISFSQS